MRYPVAANVDEFKKKWYSAQGYGAKTSYGYHEGEDLNLGLGGNSDLGYPVYSIADGQVTAVQKIPTGFGHNIHIKHDGKWGTVYSHYAHLQNIKVSSGQKVKEGQQIAEVGHTGNSRYKGVPIAHLHFAIKNKPTGLGDVANDLKELQDWENPLVFIEKWMQPSDKYVSCMRDREKFWKERDEARSKVKQLEETLAKEKEWLLKRESEIVKLTQDNEGHVKHIMTMTESHKEEVDILEDEIEILKDKLKPSKKCEEKVAEAIIIYHNKIKHKIYYNISGNMLIYLGFLKKLGIDNKEVIK